MLDVAELTFQDHLPYLAVRISVELPGRPETSIGTGFLYKASISDETKSTVILLISNKHVFADPRGILRIHFNKITDEGEPDYGNIHEFVGSDFSQLYYPHPNSDVDLACVNVSAISHEDVFFRNLHRKFLDEFDSSRLKVGSDVLFVGYPEDRYDVSNNLPIIRKGSVASLPALDFNGKPQIIIDAQVFPGSSGSPVFTNIGGNMVLLGVVSETMIKHSQLETISTTLPIVGVQQILGLGIVIKQRVVLELIEHATEHWGEKIGKPQ